MNVITSRFALSIGVLSELRIRTQPKSVLSGVSMDDMEVYMYDAGGNWIRNNAGVTVEASQYVGGGTLSGTVTQVRVCV